VKKIPLKPGNFGFEAALAFGVAAILTILLLTLGGNVRGEVERLWLFTLAPLQRWQPIGFRGGLQFLCWCCRRRKP
jgi:hypothetical protein